MVLGGGGAGRAGAVSEVGSRRLMAVCRYHRAFYILLIMPLATVETAADPSTRHLVLLPITAAQAAWSGLLYRWLVKQWTEASE